MPIDQSLHHVTRSATWCKVYEFPFQLDGQQVEMVFTSVAGHLLELNFTAPFTSWQACAPQDLFTAPVAKHTPKVSLTRAASMA